MFPKITHIDQVLPHICDGIIHMKKDGYQVLDYVHMGVPFDNEYQLECRGLKFDMDGKLIARPYHKFFNHGERNYYHQPELEHIMLEKLDGSMVHTIKDSLRFMTRAGHTDVSDRAEKLITSSIKSFMDYCSFYGYTAMFEFLDKDNPIVIKYPFSRLVLTGVRRNCDGEYMSVKNLIELSVVHGLSYVPIYDELEDISKVKDWLGTEGVVIRYHNGHMLKVKTDAYVKAHRSLDLVRRKKDLIEMCLREQLDDILPLLTEETKKEVLDTYTKVWDKFKKALQSYNTHFEYIPKMSRKEIALDIQSFNPMFKQWVFLMLDKKGTPEELLKNIWLKNIDKIAEGIM